MKYRMLAMGFAISAWTTAQLQFEVASIKPNHSGDGRLGISMEPGGRFVATNVPVRALIMVAYDLKENQVSGLPGWAASDRFDITAKSESGASFKNGDER